MNGTTKAGAAVVAGAWLFWDVWSCVRGREKNCRLCADVAPIIERHCIRCHQPAIKKGDLSLATRADLDANDYLSAGKPKESHLLEVVTSEGGAKPLMPKVGAPLSPEELKTLATGLPKELHGLLARY